MFTYSFFRNPKTGSLHLRLINNRKKAEMGLGLKASEEEFSDARSAKPKTANTHLSLTLRSIESKVREMQMDFINEGKDQNMDVKDIREMIRDSMGYLGREKKEKTDPMLLLPFIRHVMDLKETEGTRKAYRELISKIEKFCADKDSGAKKNAERMRLDDIDVPWLNAFNAWLGRYGYYDKKGMSVNTRGRHLRTLRAVINHAIDEELLTKYPFRRFKIQWEETPKRALSIERLRLLFDYKVREHQEVFRDMFKLSFMLIGMNPVDMFNASPVRDGRIEYRRAKTHKLYSIKVEPEAMELIEKWKGKERLLCLSERWLKPQIFIHDTNLRLKLIGPFGEKDRARSGYGKVVPLFPEVSLYWARHTWATIAYELDIPDATIALALGHSNRDHLTTSIYIKRNRDKIDEANRRVLDWVLYGKK